MEEKAIPTWKVYLNFGLITGVIIIVLQLIFYLLDIMTNTWLNLIPYVILIGGIIWSSKSYRDLYSDGFIAYGKAFSIGIMVALIASLLVAVFNYALYTIDNSLIEQIMTKSEEALYEQNMSDSDLEAALNMQRKFMTPAIIAVGSFVWMAVVSVILALISSIFIKKEEFPV